MVDKETSACELTEVIWICPGCNTRNIDIEELTALPICGGCEGEYSWVTIHKYLKHLK